MGRARSIPEDRVFNDQGHYKVRFSRRTQTLALAAFLALCLAVGIAGGGLTLGDVRIWYFSLTPPPLRPPAWIFAPVSLGMYVLIAVAGWLVWRQPDVRWQHHRALTSWGWQLGLTAIWAPLFFGLHLILPALAVIITLFLAVALTAAKFRPLNGSAALLMLPYLVWIGFAGYLNAGFWWLNH
jgi:tryptophan-rich sensory protein